MGKEREDEIHFQDQTHRRHRTHHRRNWTHHRWNWTHHRRNWTHHRQNWTHHRRNQIRSQPIKWSGVPQIRILIV